MDLSDMLRSVDSYCQVCGDVVPHDVFRADPSACLCTRCGATQQLMVPLQV